MGGRFKRSSRIFYFLQLCCTIDGCYAYDVKFLVWCQHELKLSLLINCKLSAINHLSWWLLACNLMSQIIVKMSMKHMDAELSNYLLNCILCKYFFSVNIDDASINMFDDGTYSAKLPAKLKYVCNNFFQKHVKILEYSPNN